MKKNRFLMLFLALVAQQSSEGSQRVGRFTERIAAVKTSFSNIDKIEGRKTFNTVSRSKSMGAAADPLKTGKKHDLFISAQIENLLGNGNPSAGDNLIDAAKAGKSTAAQIKEWITRQLDDLWKQITDLIDKVKDLKLGKADPKNLEDLNEKASNITNQLNRIGEIIKKSKLPLDDVQQLESQVDGAMNLITDAKQDLKRSIRSSALKINDGNPLKPSNSAVISSATDQKNFREQIEDIQNTMKENQETRRKLIDNIRTLESGNDISGAAKQLKETELNKLNRQLEELSTKIRGDTKEKIDLRNKMDMQNVTTSINQKNLHNKGPAQKHPTAQGTAEQVSANNEFQNSLRSSNSGSLSFQNFSSNSFTGTDLPKNVQSSSLRSQIKQSIPTPMDPPHLRPNNHTDFKRQSAARKTAAKVLTDEETIKNVLRDLLEGKLYTKSVDEWFDGFDSVKSKWSTMDPKKKKNIIWKILSDEGYLPYDEGDVSLLNADLKPKELVRKIADGEWYSIFEDEHPKKFRQWAELISSKDKEAARAILDKELQAAQAAFDKPVVIPPKSKSQIKAENAAFNEKEIQEKAEEAKRIKAENEKIVKLNNDDAYKAARSKIQELFDNPNMSGSDDILKAWNTLEYEKKRYVIHELLIDKCFVDPEIVLAIGSPWNEVVRQMATGDARDVSSLAYTLKKWKDMDEEVLSKELGISKDSADKFRKLADKMYGTNAQVHRSL